MKNSKSKVAVIIGAPKGGGAANSKELVDGDACWVSHSAAAVIGDGR